MKVWCTKDCSDLLEMHPGLVPLIPHPRVSSEDRALLWGWKVLRDSVACGKEAFGTIPSCHGCAEVTGNMLP